jgi:putative addiction module component (TIGR02574 family)
MDGSQVVPQVKRGANMRPEQIRDEINRLELSEKLLLVEDIWDSIAASNSELPLPEWQKAELDRRYGEYRDGKLALHDWTAVHEHLREKYK